MIDGFAVCLNCQRSFAGFVACRYAAVCADGCQGFLFQFPCDVAEGRKAVNGDFLRMPRRYNGVF